MIGKVLNIGKISIEKLDVVSGGQARSCAYTTGPFCVDRFRYHASSTARTALVMIEIFCIGLGNAVGRRLTSRTQSCGFDSRPEGTSNVMVTRAMVLEEH